jgi:hypothetical protein
MKRAMLLLRVYLAWRLSMNAANMTDRNTSGNNLVNWILQAIFCLTATTTYTPGAGGGSAKTVTPPFLLLLMGTAGSNTANGTEATAGSMPGYTTGGKTMGSPAFGNPAAGVISNSNSVSWTATGAWSAILAIECWDSAATKLRYLQGGITSVTLANGNTLTFPAASITGDGSQW